MMNASLKEGVVSPTSALAMAGSASVFAMASTTGSPAFVGTLAGFGANDYTRDPQGFFSAQLGLTGALAFSACGLRLYFANGTRIRYLDFNDGQVPNVSITRGNQGPSFNARGGAQTAGPAGPSQQQQGAMQGGGSMSQAMLSQVNQSQGHLVRSRSWSGVIGQVKKLLIRLTSVMW